MEQRARTATMTGFVMPVGRHARRCGLGHRLCRSPRSSFLRPLTKRADQMAGRAFTRWSRVVVFRSTFALVPCIYLIATHGGILALRTKRLASARQPLRPAIHLDGMHLHRLRVDAARRRGGDQPSPRRFFLTILSIPLLGEQVRNLSLVGGHRRLRRGAGDGPAGTRPSCKSGAPPAARPTR